MFSYSLKSYRSHFSIISLDTPLLAISRALANSLERANRYRNDCNTQTLSITSISTYLHKPSLGHRLESCRDIHQLNREPNSHAPATAHIGNGIPLCFRAGTSRRACGEPPQVSSDNWKLVGYPPSPAWRLSR